MAESMKGLHRSHRCTEVSSGNIGETVTVMGWVQKRRNLGSLIFIDLRDRSGILQIVFDEPKVGSEGFAKAGTLRSEFVVAVTGTVEKRTAAVNENLKTGDIEVIASDLRILVPSRVHPGNFYALPQSPQLFKQLLMCAGYDRYFQIARCFRDEDLRADRQPEFTQADMELSFVDVDDVIDVNERLLQYVFREAIGIDVQLPIPRMSWQEAMDRFGSDKPDTRFGMELTDVSEVVKGCGFGVFAGALEQGGSVRGINAKGQGAMPRKKIDKLVEFAKGYGAKGLAYLAVNEDGTYKSSFAKFMTEEELNALVEKMQGEPGDLLLFAADKNKVVWDVLGALRLELAKQLELIDKSRYNFLWITEFPLLEWSDEENRFMAMHHPFTMPMEEDWDKIDSDPGAVRAKAYDIVLNGTELGGGSVRIHQNDVQEKMLEVLGFTKESAYEQFGFLLNAFAYGVPPHAGLAYGLDRMVMLMMQCDSIRDVIAFPKVKDASCLMTDAPNVVDEKQLAELSLSIQAAEGDTEEV